VNTLIAFALGVASGFTLDFLRQRFIADRARERERRAGERRRALRELADSYEGVRSSLATILVGSMQAPERYKGPNIQSVWHGAFQQILGIPGSWHRDWKYALPKDEDLRRSMNQIEEQAIGIQGMLDLAGWSTKAPVTEIGRMQKRVTSLQDTARKRAAE
jgi:hypothetical protein